MEYFNIPRLETSKRFADPEEEDDFAPKMLQQGAHWWPGWSTYNHHREEISLGVPYDYHFPPVINVGYPSTGGVWIFKHSKDVRVWDETDPRELILDREPDKFHGRITVVLTMDERCTVLKKFGATFYEKVDDCGDLPKSLSEGIEKGKRYAELLKKMEDSHYVEKWLEGGHREL